MIAATVYERLVPDPVLQTWSRPLRIGSHGVTIQASADIGGVGITYVLESSGDKVNWVALVTTAQNTLVIRGFEASFPAGPWIRLRIPAGVEAMNFAVIVRKTSRFRR